jgi:flagellum-specific peptidoglycan hydrolase FlgJ
MSPDKFFKKFSGYAMGAGAALGIPHQVILAQWALESAYGGSSLANRAKNFAGIKYNSNADFKSGSYAGYNSISAFASDYVRVMRLDYYADVRQASGVSETVEALGDSPYAESADYADEIRSILRSRDVTTTTGSNVLGGATRLFNFLNSPVIWATVGIYLLFKK